MKLDIKEACYYEILNIQKPSFPEQIKQAYKKLALKYHPDKNEDKELAKLRFHQLSEAYAVLNDPTKKQKYDKFGIRESEQNQLQQFEEFMGSDFQMFEQFIDQMLNMDAMLSEMLKMDERSSKKKKKKGGRAKGKNLFQKDFESVFDFGGMDSILEDAIGDTLFEAMGMGEISQEQYNELMKDPEFKALVKAQGLSPYQVKEIMCPKSVGKIKKSRKQQSEDQISEDEEELTAEEQQFLEFGNQHIEKKKNKKKKMVISCLFDNQKLKQDEVMIHFLQNHALQHKQWLENSKKPLKPKS